MHSFTIYFKLHKFTCHYDQDKNTLTMLKIKNDDTQYLYFKQFNRCNYKLKNTEVAVIFHTSKQLYNYMELCKQKLSQLEGSILVQVQINKKNEFINLKLTKTRYSFLQVCSRQKIKSIECELKNRAGQIYKLQNESQQLRTFIKNSQSRHIKNKETIIAYQKQNEQLQLEVDEKNKQIQQLNKKMSDKLKIIQYQKENNNENNQKNQKVLLQIKEIEQKNYQLKNILTQNYKKTDQMEKTLKKFKYQIQSLKQINKTQAIKHEALQIKKRLETKQVQRLDYIVAQSIVQCTKGQTIRQIKIIVSNHEIKYQGQRAVKQHRKFP